LGTYAHLKHDEDTGNSENSGRYDRICSRGAFIDGETSWFTPELLSLDSSIFNQYRNAPELVFYKRTLNEIDRERNHCLSEKEERILGMSSEIFGLGYQCFEKLNDADLRFPKISGSDGKQIEITHGNYIKLLENQDRNVRRDAFNACYHTYASYKNTFAAMLGGTVKSACLESKLRGYDSARAASLSDDNVPVSVYDRLIDNIHGGLPSLHRYFSLRAKVLGLDKLEMFDIHNPLVPNAACKYDWNQTVQLVSDALRPLGADYCRIMKRAFSERWVDYMECRGKRSGAYSSGCYKKNPFILMNFSGTLDSVFTLAHELGHSMHSYYSDNYQDFHYASYAIFVAEVASTTNELLLHHSLMEKADNDDTRVYLLNHLIDEIRGTVFRQTMFAEFERDIYAMEEDEEPLTADVLCRHYLELNCRYHGKSVISNDEIQYEWERIPHFHYDFYVYKYATGMSAAAALVQDILQGKTDRYMGFLKAGDSKDVLDIMKDAGVDFMTDAPVKSMVKLFDTTVNELEKSLLE